ncbi:MAG: Crp/Fnr family transcriptional regulator [Deltaproteobacteria bacterium]|nr:Crp/Fnr family transcriptional regulator [Deltaproteobacteria bacterium]
MPRVPVRPRVIHCDTCTSRGSGAFCELSEKHLCELDRAKTTNRYHPHQVIFYEGNHPFGVYCVSSGKVKIYKSDLDGHQDIVRIAGPGDLLGYRCILAGEAYMATAETLDEAEICFLDRKTFLHIVETHPVTALKIMQSLAKDLREAEDHVSRVVHRSVRERLAELFLIFQTKYGVKSERGVRLNLELTRAEWAELIGTTQESVIRLMSEFRQEKLIGVEGRLITLFDLSRLATVANLVD